MAQIKKKYRMDGSAQNYLDPNEVLEEMILQKLFTAADGKTFREIVAEAKKRGFIWEYSGKLWLSK
jgi:hypothetical protein